MLPPMRGQVWKCALAPPVGAHPVVVLTVNSVAQPLAGVTVALITGTSGPRTTHVAVGPESGLKKYAESFVNCTEIHTVRKGRLRNALGLLSPGEMAAVEERLQFVLGLNPN